MGQESGRPSLGTALSALAPTLRKQREPEDGPELLRQPAPMLGQREPGQRNRTLQRKSPPPPE
jgi:hypothetical protein